MDSSRRLIILLVAGVVVAFVAIAIRSKLANSPDEVPANTLAIAAARDLSPGDLVIPANDLEWVEVQDDTPKEGLLLDSSVRLTDFSGAVVRKTVKEGDLIQSPALMRAGEGGFLSAVLEPNMRAVSIAVNATSGNAGFISPGDRVDLIVTHRIRINNSEDGGTQESVVSETFVRNVRVVAVDQMLDNPENKAILAKTVTVEVSDRQAEQVAVATEMGKISMVLRSVTTTEGQGKNPTSRTMDSDVSNMIGVGVMPRVRVIRGEEVENMEFSK